MAEYGCCHGGSRIDTRASDIRNEDCGCGCHGLLNNRGGNNMACLSNLLTDDTLLIIAIIILLYLLFCS